MSDTSYSISFGAKAVTGWANYSGDFNPIHFDIEWAKKLDVDGLVVHGMLAMLHIKHYLHQAESAASKSGTGWKKFKTMLRNPLPYGHEVNINTSQKREALKFKGAHANSETEYFKGELKPLEKTSDELLGQPILTGTINSLENIVLFREYFAESFPAWIVLDAMIFSDFMKYQIVPLRTHINHMLRDNINFQTGEEIIVHANHAVHFNSCLLSGPDLGVLIQENINYEILEPELITNPDKTICMVKCLVKQSDTELMVVEMGLLLIKTN